MVVEFLEQIAAIPGERDANIGHRCQRAADGAGSSRREGRGNRPDGRGWFRSRHRWTGKRGRGLHPAGQKFGECFAYEVAKEHACRLLYIGDDFAKTDIEGRSLIRASLPPEIPNRSATRLITEMRGINRIVYGHHLHPPARSSGSDLFPLFTLGTAEA